MPLSDTKKAQTIRNLWYAKVAKKILEADDAVAKIRTAIVGNDLATEFGGGQLTAMQAVETSLVALADLVGVTAAESNVRPTHCSHAVTITGVND